jgi:hypothetical protein
MILQIADTNQEHTAQPIQKTGYHNIGWIISPVKLQRQQPKLPWRNFI